jgi:RNA polymerase sigma factor (sigma-70 family)
VWRVESARVIAALARHVGDVAVAEDLAQDAFVAALEQWPAAGIPDNPRGWPVTVGKRRFIDSWRRRALFDSRRHELVRQDEASHQLAEEDFDAAAEEVNDDLLRLMFICCHPVLSRPARVALTLRLVGGLTTKQIARAYVVKETTISQRVVRAKKTLSEVHARFELPLAAELAERLEPVLEVLYLTFNEGYVTTSGPEWTKPTLCHEALRLGRVLARLLPGEPEVHGLVALMELQASRLRARSGPGGEPVLLADQDRRHWDQVLLHRGFVALDLAASVGDGLRRYGLQAAIAACHARAGSLAETDWARIVALYDALAEVAPSPIVDLNRAVAVSMAYGAEAALEIIDSLRFDPVLDGYHLLPSVQRQPPRAAGALGRGAPRVRASSCGDQQ